MTALLSVEGLTKAFGPARVVDDVSFTVGRGEIVGLVGESGSGKTTVGRCILRLTEPTAGRIVFDGVDLAALHGARLRARRRRIQMIFQDPFASLNPRLRIGSIVAEPIDIHGLASSRAERRRKVQALLDEVGMPADAWRRYPHEFSGGQRQRIGIARALAADPDLVVADEPVSALDVSVQAQVLNLLADLQQRRGLSMLFISHDLEVVRHLCDRIAVMYASRLMETGSGARIAARPAHPYTRALIAAVPHRDPTARKARAIVEGETPGPLALPPGCVFQSRCPHVVPHCREARPPLAPIEPGHAVACSNPRAVAACTAD
ncbi:MAG: ABC transporter ATP-binding protein [Alphaproteobacteria bacterium]|nr:ABC transporter ATP-binding protein [Alphaproteobacteria bacterium]